MTKLGIGTVVAGGLAAAILGLAAPAQAVTAAEAPTVLASAIDFAPTGIDHHAWLEGSGLAVGPGYDIHPDVNVPDVDTRVHQSR